MAKGSQATFTVYPRVCAAGCGQPLRMTGVTPLWFESCAPGFEPRSFHFACRLRHEQITEDERGLVGTPLA